MKAKMQRLVAIRQLISEKEITSQEELVVLLKRKGYDLTQATLSRDLKSLQVIKAPGLEGGYIYRLSKPDNSTTKVENTGQRFLSDGIVSLELSGNMAVIKTKPAFASSIASVIDSVNPFGILGTIAGDDTVFMVIREGIEKSDLIKIIVSIFPGLKGKNI